MNNSKKNNILDLVNPDIYNCIVWSYRVSLSRLLVRVDEGEFDKNFFYLIFEEVLYFEGPLRWGGANFCLGTDEECVKILHRRGLNGIPEGELLNLYSLFIVELPDSEVVKIVASNNIYRTSDIPQDFL